MSLADILNNVVWPSEFATSSEHEAHTLLAMTGKNRVAT